MGSISPQVIQCDDGILTTVNVFGSGFDGTTKINYEGGDVTTVLVSATQLQASFNPSGVAGPKFSEIKVTGDAAIRLLNWTPGPTHGPKSYYNYSFW